MWINFIVFLLIKILSGTFYGKESTQVSKHGSTICKAFQYEEEYICRSNKIHIVAGFVFGFFFLPSPMWSRPWEIILHPTLCKSEQRAWLCVLTSAHREGMSILALEKALLWLLTGNVLQIEEKCFTSRQPVQMLSVRFTAPWPPVASQWRKQQVAYLLLHKRRLDIVPGYELLPAMRW